jgi:hypothetical protein
MSYASSVAWVSLVGSVSVNALPNVALRSIGGGR